MMTTQLKIVKMNPHLIMSSHNIKLKCKIQERNVLLVFDIVGYSLLKHKDRPSIVYCFCIYGIGMDIVLVFTSILFCCVMYL
jgi:hypothetical protein